MVLDYGTFDYSQQYIGVTNEKQRAVFASLLQRNKYLPMSLYILLFSAFLVMLLLVNVALSDIQQNEKFLLRLK